MISDNKKLRQDLAEMLSISVQPDGFGAGIVDIIGQDFEFDDGLSSNVEFTLHDRLNSAAARFIVLQRQVVANKPITELISRVINIEAQQSDEDPTRYDWRIDFQTIDGQVKFLRGRIVAA